MDKLLEKESLLLTKYSKSADQPIGLEIGAGTSYPFVKYRSFTHTS